MNYFHNNTQMHRQTIKRIMVVLISLIFAGCSQRNRSDNDTSSLNNQEFLQKSDFLLNTIVSIQIYDKQEEALIDESFELIKKYETIFSRTEKTSELYQLNQGKATRLPDQQLTYSLSNELTDILNYAYYYSKRSSGAFDLTVAPITSLWDFNASPPSLPEEDKLRQALSFVDYRMVHLSGNTITIDKVGIGIDLGAIAKGYIADKVKEYLILRGVKSAIINLGGNLLCIGNKPDNTAFHIGIQKPYAGRNETIATLEVTDLSVVSSGIYERYFELDGKFYHHILDPKSGYPYDNGLISVTIISGKSVDGDGLSTSCFALGLERGLALIERIPDTYALFITEDYELHYSPGFESAIRIVK